MNLEDVSDLNEAMTVIDDLIGCLSEVLYKLENISDLGDYGVMDSLIDPIREALDRYESLE